MSIINRKKQTNGLQKVIDDLQEKMATVEPDSQKYSAMAKNLETLYSAKSKEKDRRVSTDTIVTVAGSLAGILIIVGYEKLNVIGSKALGFVVKGRV
jgi:hypothetical protein